LSAHPLSYDQSGIMRRLAVRSSFIPLRYGYSNLRNPSRNQHATVRGAAHPRLPLDQINHESCTQQSPSQMAPRWASISALNHVSSQAARSPLRCSRRGLAGPEPNGVETRTTVGQFVRTARPRASELLGPIRSTRWLHIAACDRSYH